MVIFWVEDYFDAGIKYK